MNKFFKDNRKNIKSKRLEKNISLEELSSNTGIRTEHLKKIESGTALKFKLSQLFLIARTLKVKPYTLAIEQIFIRT